MGRRASKASQALAVLPGFDTVGMTILPGHPLPDWAVEPLADPEPDESAQAASAGSPRTDAPGAIATASGGVAATTPADSLPSTTSASQHDMGHVLVNAGVGAALGTAAHAPSSASGPGGVGPNGNGAAPPGGSATVGSSPFAAPSSPLAPPTPRAPGSPGVGASIASPVAAAAAGAALAAASSPVGEAPAQGLGAQMPTPPAPAFQPYRGAPDASGASWPSEQVPSGGTATAVHTSGGPDASTPTAPGPPAMNPPRSGHPAPERPELSPEHVALLTWWADALAKGHFPAPPAAADGAAVPGSLAGPGQIPAAPPQGPPAPPARQSRLRRGRGRTTEAAPGDGPTTIATPAAARTPDAPPAEMPGAPGASVTDPAPDPRRRARLVALGVGGIAVVGLAVAFGPGLVTSFTKEAAPATATILTMPSTVGDLVTVSSPDVSDQLESMLGLGLRAAGVTTTAGYGPKPGSTVELAGMATTTPAAEDAEGQILVWAQRTGATVADPVAGQAQASGITCAEVTKIPDAELGSICVWAGTGTRGQSYVVDTEPEAAFEPTAALRAGVVATG